MAKKVKARKVKAMVLKLRAERRKEKAKLKAELKQ